MYTGLQGDLHAGCIVCSNTKPWTPCTTDLASGLIEDLPLLYNRADRAAGRVTMS